MNVLNANHVEEPAVALGTKPDLVEKDWQVVRAIGVLASLDHDGAKPVFSGGTSLSKGWGLIRRFSEDIDFKVIPPAAESATAIRNQRIPTLHRVYRFIKENIPGPASRERLNYYPWTSLCSNSMMTPSGACKKAILRLGPKFIGSMVKTTPLRFNSLQ